MSQISSTTRRKVVADGTTLQALQDQGQQLLQSFHVTLCHLDISFDFSGSLFFFRFTLLSFC